MFRLLVEFDDSSSMIQVISMQDAHTLIFELVLPYTHIYYTLSLFQYRIVPWLLLSVPTMTFGLILYHVLVDIIDQCHQRLSLLRKSSSICLCNLLLQARGHG